MFFEDSDRELYLSLLREYAAKYQVEILGYCLMTHHVHLIATPADATGLAKAIGRVHNDYALASYSKTRIRAFVAESFLLLSSGGCLYLGGACLCGAKRSARWNGLRNAKNGLGAVPGSISAGWIGAIGWRYRSGRKTGRRRFGGLRSRKVSSRRTSEPDCTRQPEREGP